MKTCLKRLSKEERNCPTPKNGVGNNCYLGASLEKIPQRIQTATKPTSPSPPSLETILTIEPTRSIPKNGTVAPKIICITTPRAMMAIPNSVICLHHAIALLIMVYLSRD